MKIEAAQKAIDAIGQGEFILLYNDMQPSPQGAPDSVRRTYHPRQDQFFRVSWHGRRMRCLAGITDFTPDVGKCYKYPPSARSP